MRSNLRTLAFCSVIISLFAAYQVNMHRTRIYVPLVHVNPDPPIPTTTPTVLHHEAELHSFFDLHARRWIEDLATQRYHITAIQEEYTRLALLISKKKSRRLRVGLSTAYDPASKDVMATTDGPNGEDVQIIVPALEDVYRELCAGKSE